MGTSTQVTDGRRPSSARDGWNWVHGVWQSWRLRLRMRAELRAMDRRGLADIGMDPEAALRETRKFFWQC